MPKRVGFVATVVIAIATAACGGGSSSGGTGGGVSRGGESGHGGAGGGDMIGTPGSAGAAGSRSTGGSGGGGQAGGTGGHTSGGTSGAGGRATAGAAGGGPAGSGGLGGAHNGGAAGSATAGASGGGGLGGATADPAAAASVLDGFAILKPCFSTPGTCSGCTCDENAANILNTGVAPENQHIVKQFGGDAGVTYNVKLRVAGVAERYWYTGGMLDPTSKVFYTGGLPTIHSAQAPNQNLSPGAGACKIHPPQTDGSPYNFPIPFTVPSGVAPADDCYNGFNIFAMVVSSPKQTYFLNYTTDFDGVDRQPHAVYATDYTVTVPIADQATIEFYVIDGDHHEVANTTMTVPKIKNTTIKQPYVGNFLELEVVGASVAN